MPLRSPAHTVAVVVARGGSVRLPGKALLPFAGSTLVGQKVRMLRLCPLIHEVIVGSDSDAILEEARRAGALPVKRDDHHCNEAVCSANEMIADMVSRVGGDVIVWAHPTNPLVRSETFTAAIARYQQAIAAGTHDSLCSVTRIKRHCWFNGQPDNFDPWSVRHQLAAELPAYHFQDGAIFIQPREQMAANRYFYGRRPLLFEIPAIEGTDIDNRSDYEAAVALESIKPCA